MGIQLRAHLYAQSGLWPDAPFWIESAMRFRIVQWIAAGQSVPAVDPAMQWPEGYPVFHDVIVQEYVLGGLARLFQPEVLSDFVRAATRALFCSIALPLFALGHSLTGSRRAALLAVGVYLLIPPSVDRSTGLVIYRENICLIFISLHLLFFRYYMNNGPDRSERSEAVRAVPVWHGLGWLVASGTALTLAHFTWKVIPFYQLFLQAIFTLFYIVGINTVRFRMSILVLCGMPLLGSALPGPLQVDRYWGSANAALAGALLLSSLFSLRTTRHPPLWARAALLTSLTLGLLLLLPGARSYSHAWDTLLAKLRFLGIKPEDPGLLPISARHYWTGNYNSPTLARALRDFAIPALLLGSLAGKAGWTLLFPENTTPYKPVRARETTAQSTLSRGWALAASALEDQHLPVLLLLGGALGFAVGYGLFYKFGTLLALFLCPLLAMAAQAWYIRAKHRGWMVHVLLLGACGVAFLSSWNNLGAEQVLALDVSSVAHTSSAEQRRHAQEENIAAVYPVEALNDLALWLKEAIPADAPLLASWPLAPWLVTYLHKTVVLHAYFESPNVFAVEEHYRRMFGALPELHAFAHQRQARYVILEAQMLLRTDRWMSWRYVADRLVLDGTEAAYRLHYTPQDTPGFLLVYQSAFFRVYEVLETAETRAEAPDLKPAPLFDLNVPGAQVGAPLTLGPDLLYGTLEALRTVRLGDLLLNAGRTSEAVQAYGQAVELGPYSAEAYLRLLGLAERQRRSAEAGRIRLRARQAFGDSLWDAIESRWRREAEPVPAGPSP